MIECESDTKHWHLTFGETRAYRVALREASHTKDSRTLLTCRCRLLVLLQFKYRSKVNTFS